MVGYDGAPAVLGEGDADRHLDGLVHQVAQSEMRRPVAFLFKRFGKLIVSLRKPDSGLRQNDG